MTKTGSGSLFLAGNNSYSGTTSVSGGTLEAGSPGALPGYGTASKLSVTNSATLVLAVGSSGWQSAAVNSLVSTNNGGFAAGTVLGIDTANATGGFTYGNNISGNLGLTKFGSNSLTLTGNNTYVGNTVVSAGTLAASTAGALTRCVTANSTNSTLTVLPGATLTLDVGGSGWAVTDVNNLLTHNPTSFAAGSALGIDTTNASFTYSASSLTANMGLAKMGNTTLTLTGIGNFGGSTTVSAGTLDLATGTVLQNSTLVAPTTGSILFDPTVGNKLFYVGGLSVRGT